MADDKQSIWKKEISFGRKAKPETEARPEPPRASVEHVEAAPAEKTSIWKKEISFGGKPKAEKPPKQPKAEKAPKPPKEPKPKKQPKAKKAPKPERVEAEKTSVWKKELSFGRKKNVAAETAVEAAPDGWAAPEALPPAPEPVAAATEVAPVVEPVAAVEPVAEVQPENTAAPVEEHALEESPESGSAYSFLTSSTSVWQPAEATAEIPTPKTPQPAPAPEPVPTPDPGIEPPAPEPTFPPTPPEPTFPPPQPEPVTPPQPAAVTPRAEVHPPVPAAELPPLPEDEKVPFWKRDIAFGGGKAKQPKAEKPARERSKPERKPKTKAEKPAKPTREERAQAKAAAKAERQSAPKQPKQKAPKGEKSTRAKKVVGLKIGASQIAAARISNNGHAELHQIAREELEQGIVVGGELRDPEALAEALKAFFRRHKLPKKGVRLGIANNRIGVRTFEIDGIDDPKQLANAIRFRAQEALPIPIDEAVLDYQILDETTSEDGSSSRRILLVVAYRELIDRYVSACKKAGISLVGIDLEAFALLRALGTPEHELAADRSAALVAVAIGHERSTFAVSDGRVCEFTRVLEWGGAALNIAIARVLDIAPSEAEPIKRAVSLTNAVAVEGLTDAQVDAARDAVRKQVQTFARELVSSLQFYQSQPASLGIGEIILTGGTAHLPGLAEELQRLIGVAVRVGDPLGRVRVGKKIREPEQVGSLAVAIGLGIED